MSVTIMNMALDLLEEEPILSAEDDRTVVRWMNRNYASIRDALLRQHPWNFAIRRAALPLLTDAPAFGWARQYQLPADCLRILPLDGGCLNGRDIPFRIEGRRILTNAGGPVAIYYVARVESDTDMDPMFVRALATSLAAEAASLTTGKTSMAELLAKKAQDLLMRAQQVDALEGTPPEPAADDWLDARQGFGRYYGGSGGGYAPAYAPAPVAALPPPVSSTPPPVSTPSAPLTAAVLQQLLAALPTSPPATPGQLWNDGGSIALS